MFAQATPASHKKTEPALRSRGTRRRRDVTGTAYPVDWATGPRTPFHQGTTTEVDCLAALSGSHQIAKPFCRAPSAAKGINLVAEFEADDKLVKSYLWGLDLDGQNGGAPHGQGAGGVGGLLAVTQHVGPESGTHFVTYDGNGNVTALVDAQSGNQSATCEYDPFGTPLQSTGPAAHLNPFRFSTKYHDQETGLSYYGFRFYDPQAGRWLNRDPIEEKGGPNLYAMVGNDPINQADHLGLSPILATHILRGDPTPYAVGVNVDALVSVDISPQIREAIRRVLGPVDGLTSGFGGVGIFFPDTCEVAAYTVTAGALVTDADDGGFFDPNAPDNSLNTGVYVGGAISIELAVYTSSPYKRGRASAKSFEGIFRTVQASYGVYGGSVYWGVTDPDRDTVQMQNNWFGGTVAAPPLGVGLSGGGSLTDWHYKMKGSLDLDKKWPILGKCACVIIAGTLPTP